MASKPSGIAKMIVQYEWILENVEGEPKTIASKMILFRGERVFRVGLKNHIKSPVLFFMAINFNKIGMKVEEVMYGIQDSGIGPPIMSEMEKESIGVDGNLQLFTIELDKQIIGKCTFLFRICIEGSVSGYSYQLSDRLAKYQLWDAATSKNGVDVQLVVKGQQFYAHKAILAARSPVFAADFTSEQPVVGAVAGPHQIRIDYVEPSTVKQFLHFVYTGESMGPLANEDLLKLARKYKLTTLSSLCQTALNEIKTTQMVSLTNCLHKDAEKSSSPTIRPDKDTEIFFDRTTPTFRCALSFNGSESGKSKSMMRYQNEDIFLAYFNGGTVVNALALYENYVSKPVIHFLCSKHRRFGLKVEDVFCKHDYYNWFKMEPKHFQKNAELLLHFTTQSESNILVDYSSEVKFDIKMVITIDNYYYEMMDEDWIKDFWVGATNQKLTDVEIFIGNVKLMEAHRVILSARSSVLNESLTKISHTGKSIVTFGAEFDADIVKYFLQFLYTGSLETTASKSTSHKELLKLATMFKVGTLKNFCQLANHVLDIEKLTNCLLEF